MSGRKSQRGAELTSKFTKKIRSYWHNLYYYLFGSKEGVNFAMTCKEATESADLGTSRDSLRNRFRYQLHLSICQTCKNYLVLTKVLRKAIRSLVQKNEKSGQVERLNDELLLKHVSKNDSN